MQEAVTVQSVVASQLETQSTHMPGGDYGLGERPFQSVLIVNHHNNMASLALFQL